ncbi:MAG: DEAD/DEAH box helicase [Planctomycetia bacterium]|nr:DEAD/DEAH box helicase [Planctomycetia bacterium]
MEQARRGMTVTTDILPVLSDVHWRDASGTPERVELTPGTKWGFSWKPAFLVSTFSVHPGIDVATSSATWQAIGTGASAPKSFSFPLTGALAKAVSLPITPPKLKVFSFQFPNTPGWRKNAIEPALKPAAAEVASIANVSDPRGVARPAGRTRIKPPGDIIKLEDRLLYVLQPSLETLIGEGSLAFPFHPFGYQFEGVAFLYPRYAAILADEMGLGKTMQAITAVRLLLHAGELSNVLFICPKPLVTNWQREFSQWAPELPVTTIEGDPTRRRWQWQQSETPVKIANYELLQRDRETVAELGLEFDLVVLDEAQRIKNRASATSQCARAISRRRSWALTGTPVENSPQDLVGIFEFLAPGYLSAEMKPRRMGRAAGDYVLRRTKDKVLTELPPKMFRDADVELGAQQRESYQMAETEGVLRLTEMGDSAAIQHVFELVLRLKQICNFDPATGESSKFERLAADLDEVAASGRKAIVFSQWVSTLEILSTRLAQFHPLSYHGRIPSNERDGVLEQFRDDPRRHVMLLSYGAGGVGLNLQFASYVFLFDRWWNPAVEDQAINRAHRIGAAGPVTVTRFMTLDTIEQRIDQILREKREIFDTIFTDVEPSRNLGLTQQEIFGLFKLRCPSGPIDLAA